MPRIFSKTGPQRGIRLEIVRRRGYRGLPARRVRAIVEGVLRELDRPPCGVSVLFTGDAEMRALNKKFRRRDRSTDVLSFPWEGPPGEPYLGDIAISVPTARRQAARAGWRIGEELEFLLLHAVLHLLGHDHETDTGEMDRIQTRLARTLLGRGIPGSELAPARRPSRGSRS